MALNNAINSPLLGGIPGALPVTSGGTGATSLTAGVLLGNGTGAVTSTAILDVAQGGTGAATLTSHGVLLGSGTSAVTATAELSNGQLLIGSTGNAPSAASLTAGSGITITPGAGSITIAATGSLSFTNVTGTSQTMVAGASYLASNAAQTTFTLPAAAAVGTAMNIASAPANAGGWTVVQGSGQSIQVGNSASTTGAGGSITSTSSVGGDSLQIVCTVANTTWVAYTAPQGSLTIV